VTHGVKRGEGLGGGDSVNHPNRYYERSREIEREKERHVKQEMVKSEDAMVVD
jgi:DNA primase large subunit